MSVEHVEVLVEEPSAEAALSLLLPKLLPATFTIHSHQGKSDLLGKLALKLRGYAAWLPVSWRILVLLDRDDGDCKDLKVHLEKISKDAGLATRSTARDSYTVVNRLAIEELEAWYFGDWKAVRAAYPKVPPTIPARAKYRDPDGIKGGTWEAFERLLQDAGYFASGLRKIEAARAIAAHMDPSRSTSSSFHALRDVLAEMRGT
jgi:hypothetical protein